MKHEKLSDYIESIDKSSKLDGWDGFRSSVGISNSDMVNEPKHYQIMPGVEVYDLREYLADAAMEAGASYMEFSDYDRAIEYLLRMWGKNRVEDAKKARWYLDKLIERLEDSSEVAFTEAKQYNDFVKSERF